MDIPMQKCHSIIVNGKVQDIGFRSVVEHIGRSFGMPGLVFNANDGSVKILCCGEDSVIDNFMQTIRVRGEESGAEIEGIKEILLPFNIDLPDKFSRVSSDDEIDIGRKLDKGNEFLKNLPDIKAMLGSFIGEQREHNTRLEAMVIGINEHNTCLEAMVIGINEHNTRLEAHNTRLEAILEKLANK